MGDFIKWLSNLSQKDAGIAGSKGANLGEMYNLKFPVPSAFVITIDAFNYFLKETKIEDKIKTILNKVNVDETEDLFKKTKEIQEIFLGTEVPSKLKEEIIEAYDQFNVDYNDLANSPGALSILKCARESVFVSVRSSVIADETSSFAGQQDSFINVKGNNELIEKVKGCFASVFTARSIYYRQKRGFENFAGTAVIVQKMVNSDKSGVVFSRHPVKNNGEILIEAVFGQGEGLTSGKITPDQYSVTRELELLHETISDKKFAIIRTSGGLTKTVQLTEEKNSQRVLKTYEIKQLADYVIKLEEHFQNSQSVEFAIENDEIFILQTRPITILKENKEEQELDGQVLTEGMAVSGGVVSGNVKTIKSVEDFVKVKEGDILVTSIINPDMVVVMKKVAGIIIAEGGTASRTAIISRELKIPAVFGAENCVGVLEDGQEVTVDGFSGKVYAGKAQNKKAEILPIVQTKTKIKVTINLPQFAERAAKTNSDGIGLVRLEGLVATGGKHPLVYERENRLDDYKKLLKTGLKKIADTFIGKPIWVRITDMKSDEYTILEGTPKNIERNPMLGNHGIRFSLRHLGILKTELSAIKELADNGHKFGVIFPGIILVEELKEIKKIFKEMEMNKVGLGLMIETPASTVIIKDICEEGIDFVSIGVSNLTQYTLALDRGNEDVQHLYNEMNWAVLKQISRVIRECRQHKVETSICGITTLRKEMIEYLVKQGVDSISVDIDDAKEISELVLKIENEKGIVGEIKEVEEKIKEKIMHVKEEIFS
ncbi:MAG: phosphoenolpyruvate synthase [Candidatus Pacearchaeota archaeon]